MRIVRSHFRSGLIRRAFLRLASRVPAFLKRWLWSVAGYYISRPLHVHHSADIRGRNVCIGSNVHIGPGVRIVADTIEIGDNVHIGPGSSLLADRIVIEDSVLFLGESTVRGLADFVVGEYTVFHEGFHLRGEESCYIGQNCWFGNRVFINVHSDVRIGNNVGIGQEAMLWTHGFWAEELEGYPVKIGPIVVDENAWLTPRVVVLPDVCVGDSAIVSTGAIITRDVPARTLNGGVPCKVIMEEDEYRKTLSVEDKIEATLRVLRERLAARFEIKTLLPSATLFEAPGTTFCVVAGNDTFEAEDLPTLGPECDLLFLAPSTEAGRRFHDCYPGATIFDYETKEYTKQSSLGEQVFKRTLNDRYIRFVRRESKR